MKMTCRQLLDDAKFWKLMEEEFIRQLEPIVESKVAEKRVRAAWNRFSHRQRAAIYQRVTGWMACPEPQEVPDAEASRSEGRDNEDCDS